MKHLWLIGKAHDTKGKQFYSHMSLCICTPKIHSQQAKTPKRTLDPQGTNSLYCNTQIGQGTSERYRKILRETKTATKQNRWGKNTVGSSCNGCQSLVLLVNRLCCTLIYNKAHVNDKGDSLTWEFLSRLLLQSGDQMLSWSNAAQVNTVCVGLRACKNFSKTTLSFKRFWQQSHWRKSTNTHSTKSHMQ